MAPRADILFVLATDSTHGGKHERCRSDGRASGEAWIGPDAVVDNPFVRLGEDWEPFVVQPSSFDDAGDVVTVEGRYTGVHKTPGRPLDAQFCHVWTLQDGRITKFQQYVDTGKLQDILGVPVA